ncbi:hypothetical protein DFJ73DRAFT_809103 [Zopfochytrium polystomum]|nr:hypothetical protein DFJ73DRAFT_809103 [Zopfochytrium polystomum]
MPPKRSYWSDEDEGNHKPNQNKSGAVGCGESVDSSPAFLDGLKRARQKHAPHDGGDETARADEEGEEVDYMSAAFLEAATNSKPKSERTEPYSVRRRRELEEQRRKGTVLSKAERERQARESGLQNHIMTEENKGFAMLAKLGFKKGMALGRPIAENAKEEPPILPSGPARKPLSQKPSLSRDRLLEPIPIIIRAGQAGLGHPSAPTTARSAFSADIATEGPGVAADTAVAEFEFRESAARRHTSRLTTRDLTNARAVVQSLDEGASVPRHELWPPIPSAPLGEEGAGEVGELTVLHQLIEASEEDESTFSKMENEDKLVIVLEYLRSHYQYCLYCGDRFSTAEDMAKSCPGFSREDHDE